MPKTGKLEPACAVPGHRRLSVDRETVSTRNPSAFLGTTTSTNSGKDRKDAALRKMQTVSWRRKDAGKGKGLCWNPRSRRRCGRRGSVVVTEVPRRNVALH